MLKLRFQLPVLGVIPQLNRTCLWCKGQGHIHGHRRRRIHDVQGPEILQTRMRCPQCGKTWTCYPKGITPYRHRSDRAVACGIMLYVYGLSYRYSSAALSAQGVAVHSSQIYRDMWEVYQKSNALWIIERRDRLRCIRLLGVDGTWQKMKGQPARGLMFSCDLESQQVAEIELIDEGETFLLQKKIAEWKHQYQVNAIMTDGHSNYEYLDDYTALECRHMICAAHFVKAKVIRVRDLQEECQRRRFGRMERILERLDEVLHDLSPPQQKILQRLFEEALPYKESYSHARRRHSRRPRHYSCGYRIYLLVTEIMEKFPDLIEQPVSTNNATERGIGLSLKIRSKLMRGFVKPQNVLFFSRFMAFARAHGPSYDLAQVV